MELSSRRTWIRRCLAFLGGGAAVLSFPGAPRATGEAPECADICLDQDNAAFGEVGWVYGDEGALVPRIEILALDAELVSYTIIARLRVSGSEYEWTVARQDLDPYELYTADLILPREADMSGTDVFPGQLLVHVEAWSGESGEMLSNVYLPPLRVLSGGDGEVILLDAWEAAGVAPQGVADAETLAALRGYEDSEDGVVEYGPLATPRSEAP